MKRVGENEERIPLVQIYHPLSPATAAILPAAPVVTHRRGRSL